MLSVLPGCGHNPLCWTKPIFDDDDGARGKVRGRPKSSRFTHTAKKNVLEIHQVLDEIFKHGPCTMNACIYNIFCLLSNMFSPWRFTVTAPFVVIHWSCETHSLYIWPQLALMKSHARGWPMGLPAMLIMVEVASCLRIFSGSRQYCRYLKHIHSEDKSLMFQMYCSLLCATVDWKWI